MDALLAEPVIGGQFHFDRQDLAENRHRQEPSPRRARQPEVARLMFSVDIAFRIHSAAVTWQRSLISIRGLSRLFMFRISVSTDSRNLSAELQPHQYRNWAISHCFPRLSIAPEVPELFRHPSPTRPALPYPEFPGGLIQVDYPLFSANFQLSFRVYRDHTFHIKAYIVNLITVRTSSKTPCRTRFNNNFLTKMRKCGVNFLLTSDIFHWRIPLVIHYRWSDS
jgi:hypothetical protein